MTLGLALVGVSKDPTVGNDQKEPTFWRKVTRCFLTQMKKGDYRKKLNSTHSGEI